MPDLALTSPPPRTELLRQLRTRIHAAAPELRLIAQELLAAGSPIDFVAVDPQGDVTLLLVGGPGEDLELVARGLAQRAWVVPRVRDWLQLAPELGVRPGAGVRLILLSPGFSAESIGACQALGDAAPALWTYLCVRNGAGVDTLVEVLEAPAHRSDSAPAAPDGAPTFRTGLSEADLGLSPAERREFE